MIDDCKAGNIDMIITKSISRFARNTLDCLKYIRQLKDMNIPVLFEKESINTMEAILCYFAVIYFSSRCFSVLPHKLCNIYLFLYWDRGLTAPEPLSLDVSA